MESREIVNHDVSFSLIPTAVAEALIYSSNSLLINFSHEKRLSGILKELLPETIQTGGPKYCKG